MSFLRRRKTDSDRLSEEARPAPAAESAPPPAVKGPARRTAPTPPAPRAPPPSPVPAGPPPPLPEAPEGSAAPPARPRAGYAVCFVCRTPLERGSCPTCRMTWVE